MDKLIEFAAHYSVEMLAMASVDPKEASIAFLKATMDTFETSEEANDFRETVARRTREIAEERCSDD